MLKLLTGTAVLIAACGPAHVQDSDAAADSETDADDTGGVSLTREIGSGHVGVSAIFVIPAKAGIHFLLVRQTESSGNGPPIKSGVTI